MTYCKIFVKIVKTKKGAEMSFKHLRVSEETHKQVKALASGEGIKIDDIIKKMIAQYKGAKSKRGIK